MNITTIDEIVDILSIKSTKTKDIIYKEVMNYIKERTESDKPYENINLAREYFYNKIDERLYKNIKVA